MSHLATRTDIHVCMYVERTISDGRKPGGTRHELSVQCSVYAWLAVRLQRWADCWNSDDTTDCTYPRKTTSTHTHPWVSLISSNIPRFSLFRPFFLPFAHMPISSLLCSFLSIFPFFFNFTFLYFPRHCRTWHMIVSSSLKPAYAEFTHQPHWRVQSYFYYSLLWKKPLLQDNLTNHIILLIRQFICVSCYLIDQWRASTH